MNKPIPATIRGLGLLTHAHPSARGSGVGSLGFYQLLPTISLAVASAAA